MKTHYREPAMLKVITMTGALALLTGCAVGPDYQPPSTPEPEALKSVQRTPPLSNRLGVSVTVSNR